VAAQALGVGLHNVIINETATDKVANASPTAASFSSDINGFAILDACGQLMKRLRPRVEQAHNKLFPNTKEAELTSAELDIVWKAAVTQAYADREDLSAHGFCKIPGVRMDWATGTGTPFAYFTQGAAVAVVEIDTLTGDHTVLSADVVMDLGSSLNPGLDAGQVEGAFTQGMGWLTMEELVRGDKQHPWAKPGSLVTQGPGTYKIPSFNDTPLDFNLYLLQDHPNVGPVQLHSSKAVGEPPLFLASSVFFAIKNAIAAKRAEHNVLGDFDVSAPLSCEQIRMACADPVAARFTGNNPQFKTKGSF
jgi:xanthine dehydrogenase/oxidase